MANTIPIAANTTARSNGACPHGLPLAACPVCSGAGGGTRKAFSKPAEWSYQKCAAAGLQIKAAALRRGQTNAFYENKLLQNIQFGKNILNLLNRLNSLISNQFSQNIFSAAFLKAQPAFAEISSSISVFVLKTAADAKQLSITLYQTAEKLAAVLGEIKNFINKKISENLKFLNKKIKKFIFFCFSADETIGENSENYNNDDTLAVFKSRELRKYIVKIFKKYNYDDNRSPSDTDK